MKLLDVNILVQAHRPDAELHGQVRPWLETALREAPGVAVTDLVLAGVVRVVTHPKVFVRPTPLSQALAFVEDFRGRAGVTVVHPGHLHGDVFRRICREADARGNLVADAFHAAVAIEFGLEWITLDHDFARFPGLRWRSPVD